MLLAVCWLFSAYLFFGVGFVSALCVLVACFVFAYWLNLVCVFFCWRRACVLDLVLYICLLFDRFVVAGWWYVC